MVRGAIALAILAAWGTASLVCGDEPTLRVMSFNIRYGTAADGADAWDKRREFLIEVIREFRPDLLGTQEVLAEQADYLREKLTDYTLVGVGRDDGQRKGEFSAALYRQDRFEPVASGTFWLSETPNVPGSKSWDSSLPRVATWVKLRDREAGGREIMFLNTHWDHRGRQARVEAGKIIRRWLDEHARGCEAVVTGDLNVTEHHEGVRAMLADSATPRLFDAYRQKHPTAGADEGTFHGFRGGAKGRRIDFVLGTAELPVREADILRASRAGRYPSDHYPVTAVLGVKEE